VLVIGGGLIGCAAAWRLASAGADVLLVETTEINVGASGRNAGSLHFQIERRFLEQDAARASEAAPVVALNALAIDDWRRLPGELGADIGLSMMGGLMIAETPAEVALLEAKTRLEEQNGLQSRLLDGGETLALAPYLSRAICAASYAPDEGHADPKRVTPALAAAARASGALLHERTCVVSVRSVAGGFRVGLTTAGESWHIETASLLIAAGAWTPRVAMLADLHIPLFPVGLTMSVSERVAAFIPHLVQHVGRRLSLKQARAGNVLIGGGWPSRLGRRLDGGFDPGERPELLQPSLLANLRAAVDVVPAIADLNLIRSWTATTCISADQLPIAGEVPRKPGLFVVGGGSAFTLGPTLARLVADAMLGRTDPKLAIVSPARFEHLNSFMGAA
jgi:glycine/D-amino acid oxidase-like deaminating enzyme